jgi:hypothetical protein
MIIIVSSRAEKAVRRLAKALGTTVSEAVAVACERLADEKDQAARRRRRTAELDRVLAEIWERHELPATAEERARLADHRDLYGPDGLPL